MAPENTVGTPESTPELTFGEKAVGITFNPGGNELVNTCKQHFAQSINFLHTLRREAQEKGDSEKVRMYSLAITAAQEAQMWGVKAITWSN